MSENSKPSDKPSVSVVASQYLRELLTSVQVKRSDLVVEHVCQKPPQIAPGEHKESAVEYLQRVREEFRNLPEPRSERIEVEAPCVVLALEKTRYFNGFLRSRVVFGFDVKLALELSAEDADKIQPVLALLGYETQRLPTIPKAEASF